MGIRIVREFGDDVLRKKSKPVRELTPRLQQLIDDMFETMYDQEGVGLAAPQVGVLRRIVVIDVTGENPLVFVNPEILESDGEQTGAEGCLSLPGKHATVTRPSHVKVRALDRQMQPFELEAEGLLARAVCHEFDHLEGVLYIDKMSGELEDNAAPEGDEE